MTATGCDVSVAVIGGGPIGLTTFIGLCRAGIDVVLFESHDGTAHVPKALLLNEQTVEVFRRLGIDEAVRAASLPRDEVGFAYRAASLVAEEYDRSPMVYRSERTRVESLLCSQDALEPVLLGVAQRLAPGRARFGTRVEGITQDPDGVELRIVELGSGTQSVIRCAYAVAADGSRSRTREALGVGMEGEASLGHSLHVIFEAPIGAYVSDRRSAMYYVGDAVIVIVDGDRRWRMLLEYDPSSGETFDDARLTEIIRKAVGIDDLEVEILGVYPWQPAALLADRYRVGRVFLAGDAAQVRPPWGGLGMNVGISDADNLTWKLAAIVAGEAGDGLLDTYEQERRPIAARTLQAAIGNRRFVGVVDPAGRAAADRRRQAEGLVLGYTYSSDAVIPDGSDPPAVDDPHSDYVPMARPGHRAPHFWIADGARQTSVTDLFGDGFVLLAGAEAGAWSAAARDVAATLEIRLRAYVVGGRDADLPDPDDRWAELYCGSAAGAVLVRPDGVVGWRSSKLPSDPAASLASVLRRILGRTGSLSSPDLSPVEFRPSR